MKSFEILTVNFWKLLTQKCSQMLFYFKVVMFNNYENINVMFIKIIFIINLTWYLWTIDKLDIHFEIWIQFYEVNLPEKCQGI